MTKNAFTITCDDPTKLISDISVMNGRSHAKVLAKWDTGATTSCISPQLARMIGSKPIGSHVVGTSSGESVTNLHKVSIMLPNGIAVSGLRVFEADIQGLGFDVLVGMDVITHGDLAISSRDGVTQFSFRIPSLEDADYTKPQVNGLL